MKARQSTAQFSNLTRTHTDLISRPRSHSTIAAKYYQAALRVKGGSRKLMPSMPTYMTAIQMVKYI